MTQQHKIVSGIKWSAVSQTGRQISQIITAIILAHLLSPTDFGMVGMAMVIIGFVNIFKDLGTSAAIIQRNDLKDDLLSSIFWLNVCFGLIAMILVVLAAPLAGLFYHAPKVIPLLRVLAVCFIISGCSILQQALLEREMSFETLAKIEITAVGCGACLGIILAVMGAGAWSLVFQSLLTATVTTAYLWKECPWRPRLAFYWHDIQTVSSYSINLIGANIFDYLATNIDYLLIGRYLGPQDLGYYTLAYKILLFPILNIARVIGRVMFPVCSRLQDDNRRFKYAYLKMTSSIALVSFPIMAGTLALAEPLVSVVFGPQWQPAVLLIMLLSPLGMMQSIGTTVGIIFNAKGRTDVGFKWSFFANSYIVIAFCIGIRWGINGVAAAYLIASFLISYLSFAIPFKLINLQVNYLVKSIWKPFINSLILLLFLFLFKKVGLPIFNTTSFLILSIILGLILYISLNILDNKKQFLAFITLFFSSKTTVSN